MMIRVGNFVMTPKQFSDFVERGVLDCRTSFSVEVTAEEYKVLEGMIEKAEQVNPSWRDIPVYVKEPK